jgi:hypothetical protein
MNLQRIPLGRVVSMHAILEEEVACISPFNRAKDARNATSFAVALYRILKRPKKASPGSRYEGSRNMSSCSSYPHQVRIDVTALHRSHLCKLIQRTSELSPGLEFVNTLLRAIMMCDNADCSSVCSIPVSQSVSHYPTTRY